VAGFDRSQRLNPITSLDYLMTHAGERKFEDFAHICLVVDYQHPFHAHITYQY
jgi:hypothetical protein